MMGLNAMRSETPPTTAVLSTTREWVDDATLREGWAQFARHVRRDVHPDTRYAWFREWTTGRNDGIRRTHYHSIWSHLTDEQGQHVARISHEVWGRLAGAYSEHAHGSQRVYDAGGLAKYVAGLAGHHLKAGQAPPPGWSGRRFGTSRGFYATDPAELRKEATAAVRDDRLRRHLEHVMADDDTLPDALPADIWDELLTERLEAARARPPVRIVRIKPGTWGR
jgi:cobalamin biosynthesis Mg chelatase CobN